MVAETGRWCFFVCLCRNILENAEKEYRQRGINTIFKNDRCHFGISQFYESWKLRGDDPFLYSHGFFRWYDDNTPENAARINKRLPKDFNIRYNPEVFILNYYYHYSNDVRRAGNERIEVKIKPDYVRAVAQIQKEMKKRIGRRGIAIETNPTSNFVIGTFKTHKTIYAIINILAIISVFYCKLCRKGTK